MFVFETCMYDWQLTENTGASESDCAETGPVNRYDSPLYYFVPERAAMRGVISTYRNHIE